MTKQIGLLRGVGLTVASVAFVLAWSSGFLVAKIGTVDASTVTLLVWRFLPLAVVLLSISAVTGKLRGLTWRGLGHQAGIGMLGQFGYCIAVYTAIAMGVASGTTALIDAVQPILVATLVGPILGLRVRGAQWLGLLVGSAGVLLVVSSQSEVIDTNIAAYAFPVLAMVFLILGTLIDRRSPSDLPVLTTLTVHTNVTALALTVISLLTGAFWPPPSSVFWTVVIFAAVVPTIFGYGLYWWLLRRVGVTALNALLFLVAPATAAAGTLLFGEPLTLVTTAGFVLCAGGVALVLANESRRPVPAARQDTQAPEAAVAAASLAGGSRPAGAKPVPR